MRNGVNSLARHGLAYPVSYDVATRDLSTMLMLSKKGLRHLSEALDN
jgi:hypothetical protein